MRRPLCVLGKTSSPPPLSLQIEYELVGTLWGREYFLDPTGSETMIISPWPFNCADYALPSSCIHLALQSTRSLETVGFGKGSRVLLVFKSLWQLLGLRWLSLVASRYCLEIRYFEWVELVSQARFKHIVSGIQFHGARTARMSREYVVWESILVERKTVQN